MAEQPLVQSQAMTTMEKPKKSSSSECLGRTMMSALSCAMSDVVVLRNGIPDVNYEMGKRELKEFLRNDMEDDDRRTIEQPLPEGSMLKACGAEKLQTFTKKLCRHIFQIAKAAAQEKRLCETKMKNYESARTKERLQLEDCNRKLKEIQNELGTFKEEVDEHRVARIALQDKLIEAQNTLIEAQNRENNLISESVQKQLHDYSKVLVQNCSAAIAPSRLKEAWKKATVSSPPTESATPDRKLNLVLFGLPETTARVTDNEVQEIFAELNLKPVVTSTKRVGLKTDDRARPVIVTLERRESLLQLLRKAKQLQKSEKFSSVFLSPDLTPEEQRERKSLVDTLKELKRDNPNGRYYISKGVIKCG